MMFKISVAMATYNGEKYLSKQLESILLQERKIDEIIVSDDNSNDNSLCILKKWQKVFADEGISFLILRNPGKGVKDNFFNAIEKCNGDIIILCDQDDYWLDDKVELIEHAFLVNKDIMALNSSFEYIDEKGTKIYVKKHNHHTNNNLINLEIAENAIINIPFELVFNKNISPGMTMAITKELADIYLFNSKKMYIHDWELNCIAAKLGGLFYFNRVLTKYRIHSSQTISIASLKKESKLDIINRKVIQERRSIPEKIDLICELQGIENNQYQKFLIDMNNFYRLRRDVAIEKKIHKIPELILCNFKYKQLYKHIDFRYILIDCISCINR